MVSFSKLVEYINFPFAIAYWRLMLIGKSWICSGESASEGSDANSKKCSFRDSPQFSTMLSICIH